MSPRTGRPTDDPKEISMRIRISEADREALETGSRRMGVTMAEFIRRAIHKLSDETERKD